ncbi:MAG: hypothetical protein DCC50_04080 [Acidobacteria bacterium]|nr:MAG: hypothetical protein DCC50_04080 [Acidobacteriota bacterium]
MYRGGPLATGVEELGAVVVAGLLHVLGSGHDVVGQVERQEVGLLVVAARRDLALGASHHHAAVEPDEAPTRSTGTR